MSASVRLVRRGSERSDVIALLTPEIEIRDDGTQLPVAVLGRSAGLAEAVELARGGPVAHVVLWPDSPAELAELASSEGEPLTCPVTVLLEGFAGAGGWAGLTSGALTVRVLPVDPAGVAQTIKEELQVWPA